jgi:enamine deaminase RidA (YjgF/YER057c/UK114 family)
MGQGGVVRLLVQRGAEVDARDWFGSTPLEAASEEGFDDVVKTTIFLADMADFAAVNAVYRGYFSEAAPARSTVQVGALPGGYLVEIDAVAAR